MPGMEKEYLFLIVNCIITSAYKAASQTSIDFFLLIRAVPRVYGGSQARGRIGAASAGLHHSHSNVGSELCLRPIPQLMAMPDP